MSRNSLNDCLVSGINKVNIPKIPIFEKIPDRKIDIDASDFLQKSGIHK
jgi:hypothetical protein